MYSVVTGQLYFSGSHSCLNVWLCLRLLMSWWTPSSPTESSHRWRPPSDVLCCNVSDIEEAPSTPMGLWFRYRYFRVEFLQSAVPSSTAPSLLMWQSSRYNNVSVHLEWSLSTDAKPSMFAMLKWEFKMFSIVRELLWPCKLWLPEKFNMIQVNLFPSLVPRPYALKRREHGDIQQITQASLVSGENFTSANHIAENTICDSRTLETLGYFSMMTAILLALSYQFCYEFLMKPVVLSKCHLMVGVLAQENMMNLMIDHIALIVFQGQWDMQTPSDFARLALYPGRVRGETLLLCSLGTRLLQQTIQNSLYSWCSSLQYFIFSATKHCKLGCRLMNVTLPFQVHLLLHYKSWRVYGSL